MTSEFVFVLHEESDGAYAQALAKDLDHLAAIAIPVTRQRRLEFGKGACCIAVISHAALASAHVLSAMERGGRAIIVRLPGVSPPDFEAGKIRLIEGTGEASLDAKSLVKAIAAQPPGSNANVVGVPSWRPKLGDALESKRSMGRSQDRVIQSVLGIVATLGLAALAAEFISITSAAEGDVRSARSTIAVEQSKNVASSSSKFMADASKGALHAARSAIDILELNSHRDGVSGRSAGLGKL